MKENFIKLVVRIFARLIDRQVIEVFIHYFNYTVLAEDLLGDLKDCVQVQDYAGMDDIEVDSNY